MIVGDSNWELTVESYANSDFLQDFYWLIMAETEANASTDTVQNQSTRNQHDVRQVQRNFRLQIVLSIRGTSAWMPFSHLCSMLCPCWPTRKSTSA